MDHFRQETDVALVWTAVDGTMSMVYVNIVGDPQFPDHQFSPQVDIRGETTIDTPSLEFLNTQFDGRITWTGEDRRINTAGISNDRLVFLYKKTSNETTNHGPSTGIGFYAWTGTDKRINLAYDLLENGEFSFKHTLDETSDYAPAAVTGSSPTYVAWTGEDGRINLIQLDPESFEMRIKITFSEKSKTSPSIAIDIFTGPQGVVHLAWTAPDGHLTTAKVDLSTCSLVNFRRYAEMSNFAPSLIHYAGKLHIAWTDKASSKINVALVDKELKNKRTVPGAITKMAPMLKTLRHIKGPSSL